MQAETAFIGLLQANKKIIHKVCNLYMQDAAGREDLFQEIVLNAWQGFKNFKQEAKFSTWLYRVALNTAVTFYRKEKRKPATTSLPATDIFLADEQPDNEAAFNAMYKAIAGLNNIDKAIVMLYLDDYSYQEIAATIGITANNVAVKMNRIKTKLKETVQQQNG
jgi:RNA polymerase sigma-70 factor (ECF subfamily)